MNIMQVLFKLSLILTLLLGPGVDSPRIVSQLSVTQHSGGCYSAPVSECYSWLIAGDGVQWGHWAGDGVVRVGGGELHSHEENHYIK